MARIATYQNDELINDQDRLIGTDGGQLGADGRVIAGTAGRTRNFSVGQLRAYIESRSSDTTGDYNTVLLTSSPAEQASLFTAYAVYSENSNVMLTLPTVGADGTAIEDGSWIRFTFIGTTGGIIYAGSSNTANIAPGDRFMAGIGADGRTVGDPHLLMITQDNVATFELIYVADPITIDGTTAPVGWIIVN